MTDKNNFRIEITGVRKAQIFQGDFNWGEIEIPLNSWENLIVGLKAIASFAETDVEPDPLNPPIPVPTPTPLPTPSCTGPFCPGGTPFLTIEELRQHMLDPITNPGRPNFKEFQLKDENIISIKNSAVGEMLK